MLQVERGMPAGIVLAMAVNGGLVGALPELSEVLQRLLHFAFVADDADERLHHFLQLTLDLVGTLRTGAGGRAALERLECLFGRGLDVSVVDIHGCVFFRKLCRVFTRALAKNEQVGKRVAA